MATTTEQPLQLRTGLETIIGIRAIIELWLYGTQTQQLVAGVELRKRFRKTFPKQTRSRILTLKQAEGK